MLNWIRLLKYRFLEYEIFYGTMIGRTKFVWIFRNDRGSKEYFATKTLGLDGVVDDTSYLLSDD